MTRPLPWFRSVLNQGSALSARTWGVARRLRPVQGVTRVFRDRPWVGIVAAVSLVGLAIGVTGLLMSPSPAATPVAANQPDVVLTPAPPAITTTSVEPGAVILTTVVDELPLFSGPEAGTPEQHLSRWSDYGSPRTLMADTVHTIGDDTWYQVLLPLKPHGQTGWVNGADVTVGSVTSSVVVDLGSRTLTVFEGGEEVLTATVAVGTEQTPTPLGTFYMTDPLDLTLDDSGIYGAYALGLSGYSEVLETFNGAPPQIAIHGTNQPWLLGQDVSNGCIRLSNEDVLRVAELVELGTPVTIM